MQNSLKGLRRCGSPSKVAIVERHQRLACSLIDPILCVEQRTGQCSIVVYLVSIALRQHCICISDLDSRSRSELGGVS